MADPEQIYQEVLQEEQQKGSHPSVAEGRAKAARVRAEHGSPHPTEPRWWPGAQPQFEGGDGAAPAAEAAEVSPGVAPAEEPAQPVAQTAAPTPAPANVEREQQPAPQEVPAAAADLPAAPDRASQPAAGPAVAQPAAAAAVAAAATPTQLEPEQRPAGVTHGTTTGTRLRPEDEVATEAMFEGQRAMYERRRLIDELVATGVPAVTAEDTGRSRAPLLAVLYLLIPLIAIGLLTGNRENVAAPASEPTDGGGAEADAVVTAANISFDTSRIELPAEGATIEFINEDTVQHNIAIYQDDSAADEVFGGEIIEGGESITYDVGTIEPGNYYFQCDVHPNMNGQVVVEGAAGGGGGGEAGGGGG